MATRRLFLTLSHNKLTRSVPPHRTGMSSKRPHSARHDSGLPSSSNGNDSRQRRRHAPSRRPPKGQRQQQQHRSASGKSNSRPTHFLALPIGHHPELRNAMSALTSSWLAHEPPIEGLDRSIIVHPRRLHLTLGVMALTTTTSRPDPNCEQSQQGQEQQHDLTSAAALLASLAPRIHALLARSPLRVPLGRLATMQQDPERAHVLYVEPDLRSPDGRRLGAVCGTC